MKSLSAKSNTLFKKLLMGTSVAMLGMHLSAAQAAKCEYVVANDWGSGFTATIRITNNGTASVSGWNVGWSYSDGSRTTSSWNATVSGSNPYTAGPVGWNSNIAVGSSVEFGIQGNNGSGKAQVPTVTGSVCNSGSTSSVASSSVPSSAPRSSSSSSSSTPSSIPYQSSTPRTSSSVASSSVRSSSSAASGQACNWYGSVTPLCATTTNGWGYENGKSCVSPSTCSGQPSPFGIVSGTSSTATSSSRSSSSRIAVSSSIASSSRSSVVSSSVASSSRSSVASSSSSSITTGATCNGYATRYWDCCKGHCAWTGNVPALVTPLPSCGVNNAPLTNASAGSACDSGNAHMCWGQAPFTVSDKLAYGYAATSGGDVCGRCYQLEFTGQSHNAPGDPGSAALAGKVMIVQATNIGYDVSGGQFDILVPGGGVGAFNACAAQWGVSNAELGAQYGGLLAACKQELGYNASLAQYKACLTNRCDSVFGSRGLTELQQACNWYANWFEAADNPALKFKEVACPAELISRSGMNRGVLNDIKNTCN